MQVGQKLWTKEQGWIDTTIQSFTETPQLVFVFGSRSLIEDQNVFQQVKAQYPKSHILSCSTAGEIAKKYVYDDSIVIIPIFFEKTTVQFAQHSIANGEESFAVGKALADSLSKEGLVHVMVFSDGLRVNGTQLAKGLNERLPQTVSVTGGLVGDSSLFKKTVVGIDAVATEGNIVIVGFYGNSLKVGYGSFGGWDIFGIERTITKSKGNVLYELDGKPALALYKEYLGEKAKELPSSGLLFPLCLSVDQDTNNDVVRTILAVNEKENSLTFAGDMPEGGRVALMKANVERLIDGAAKACSKSIEVLHNSFPDLAILISCIGRKLVLKDRTDNEIEAVRDLVGETCVIGGFYSYGELCPTSSTSKQCFLHNQTMTITTFQEG